MENWRKFVNLTICGLNFDSNKQPCSIQTQAYHPLFVLRTCASCILMAASVVYKGFCEYDN